MRANAHANDSSAEATVAEDKSPSYLATTRHPLACLVFLVPLIAFYECGVIWMGGANPQALRNGADYWFRSSLAEYGFHQIWAAPLLVVAILFFRSLVERKGRPTRLFSTIFGMLVESAIYAVLLWAFSRNFLMLLEHSGIALANIPIQSPALGQLITFIGAGIYEEVLFRLGLFSICCILLRILLPGVIAVPIAALFAAVVFAAAHHVGPNREWPIQPPVFLFRMLAGLFFTILFIARGFGIAVGAHAGYDILVGVAVQPIAPG